MFSESAGKKQKHWGYMQERMPYFDHVRGILVALMIMCHTVIVYGTDRVVESPLGIFLAKIMGTWPGAPVFMILEGIEFYYTDFYDKYLPNASYIALYKNKERVGIYATMGKGYGNIPSTMKGLIAREVEQEKYKKII